MNSSEREVRAFLAEQPGNPSKPEPLTGGAWSSAWAYRAGGEDLVVRFGQDGSWYEADRLAMAFDSPDLPVPEVTEIGTTAAGRAYAISRRHHGGFLENVPEDRSDTVAGTLTSLLAALFRTPAPADAPVSWHPAAEPMPSWRAYLLDAMVDDPSKPVHGWGERLAADPELGPLAAAVSDRITQGLDACPERRDLVHGDLLHGNVLVSEDSSRVNAVLSWKCSARGDFLFDLAWCSFWSAFHPGIAAAMPKTTLLEDPAVLADDGALVDAAERHYCYQLHIGWTHLGWNIWTGNQEALAATARCLAEVLDRGPSLPG